MMNDGAIRNLEHIQEVDSERKTPRAVTIAFIMLGGACVAFAALALGGRKSAPDVARVDPLGDLVSQRGHAGANSSARATDLSTKDVTFPGMLSDGENPTTALAAVRVGANPPSTVVVPGSPPPATDKLPVVPLPAQSLLDATPVVTRPRDGLTQAANNAAQMATPSGPTAPAGKDGGYQLQVSSFRTQTEAQHFADQLRARGHKAYTIEAHVPGRGTWFRVRIGPFPSQVQASNYRTSFEQREHVVPFIVPPPTKTEQH
jgi:cell division septation protein DedD